MLDSFYEGERSNMSKTRDETRHSIFRAKQRYFLSLSKEDILSIVTLIQLNLPETTEFVCSESNRISIWKVLPIVDSLFMMFKLKKHIDKVKEEIKGYDNVRAFNHYFGDSIFYL